MVAYTASYLAQAPPSLLPEVAVAVSPEPAATEKQEDDDFGDFAEPPSVIAAIGPSPHTLGTHSMPWSDTPTSPL